MSAGTVFNEDAGFRLLVGQNEEFPLLQVKYIAKENWVSMMIRLGTSLSLLVRGTVWKSLEVASPPAKIPSSGGLRVTSTFPWCAFLVQLFQVFWNWRILLQQPEAADLPGRLIPSLYTRGEFSFLEKDFEREESSWIGFMMHPSFNQCFDDSLHSSSFKRYSRSSCQLECGIKKALSTVDCLPW